MFKKIFPQRSGGLFFHFKHICCHSNQFFFLENNKSFRIHFISLNSDNNPLKKYHFIFFVLLFFYLSTRHIFEQSFHELNNHNSLFSHNSHFISSYYLMSSIFFNCRSRNPSSGYWIAPSFFFLSYYLEKKNFKQKHF